MFFIYFLWRYSTRVQAEVHEERTLVIRRVEVRATERVREVITEEVVRELLEDVDTMGLELEGVNRLGVSRVVVTKALNLRVGRDVSSVARVEGNSRVRNELAV